MRAWGPQSDLEPKVNRKASSAAALTHMLGPSQPLWEAGVGLPRMSWGRGETCHSCSWALQGGSEGSRRGSRHPDTTSYPQAPRL